MTRSYLHYLNGWILRATDPPHPAVGTTAPLQQVNTYAYDHRGKQVSWDRDPDLGHPGLANRTMTRTFAADGTMLNRSANIGGHAQRSYAYTYDADRRLTGVQETDPTRNNPHEGFSYDAADRLLVTNDSARQTDTVLGYDENGNVKQRLTDGTVSTSGTTYAGGKSTTFVYDA